MNRTYPDNSVVELDNKSGIIIRLNNEEIKDIESHDALVLVMRDEKGKIVGIDIEYREEK
ncbi:MAG: hypothetical protein JZD40_02315 [Sulfolobus sp.]|nr:hypothetical protein [Sulfolobus sp.]